MSTLLTFFSCYLFCFLGIYEALELRDGGSDYLGKGVSKVSYHGRVHIVLVENGYPMLILLLCLVLWLI